MPLGSTTGGITGGTTGGITGLAGIAGLAVAVGCGGNGAGPPPRAPAGCAAAPCSVDAIAAELEAMSGPILDGRRQTFRDILADALAKDAFLCRPSPREVFGGGAPEGQRRIEGVMPHYGVFLGPMRYVVRRRAEASGGAVPARWEVDARIAVDPPRAATLELPSCDLGEDLLACAGTPYAQAGSTDACPGSGSFTARATPRAVRALLARWSRDVERYWNRDARAFSLPVTYDFDFVLAADAAARALRVDMWVPLSPTCGRTPYAAAMRSGWSLPILAHEVGHLLGLLDEYEALSGIFAFYPKTPFPGAEISRMGLSMREDTRLLPVHHYLVLRRFFCEEPASRDPYAAALP